MEEVKDTQRANVRIGYDGRVHKIFRGPKAAERFANEVNVLRYLEQAGCDFVPQLLETDPDELKMITTNCGSRVDHLDEGRMRELYAELELYGVRHDDAEMRNVTYRQSDGRFCLIDFEFATILPGFAQNDEESPAKGSATKRLRWFAWTDRGKVRPNNEDSFLCLQFDAQEVRYLGRIGEARTGNADFIFAVSDGMGGAKAGEFASRITVEKITRLMPRSFKPSTKGTGAGPEDVLTELFQEIHRALSYLGGSDPDCSGMGATLSLCWFTPGRMYFGHIGDSRIYYLPAQGGGIKQISHDDTHVGWLYRKGEINERQARDHPGRNALQKALGAGHQFVDPQFGAVDYETGDRFLLCTDGVVDGLYDAQMLDTVHQASSDGGESNPAQALVRAALEQSGRDNTTALLVGVE